MRLEQLRQIDLNLLITFAVVAEERSVTAAASRLLRSQPAVSRALQRARVMLEDDLLVRSPSGFEPTLRGRKILGELAGLLPQMAELVRPGSFDPAEEEALFRIAGPDNVCAVMIPRLARQWATEKYKTRFDFLPWQLGGTDLLERGKLDLVLNIDGGLLPSHLNTERLYREEWVCVVDRNHRLRTRPGLKQYLAANHLIVGTLPGVETIPDKQLAALGKKRRSSLRVPYFNAALQCLRNTDLVLTLTSGMAHIAERDSQLRVVKAPVELRGFYFQMIWHPRLNSDPRHSWLREVFRLSGRAIGAGTPR